MVKREALWQHFAVEEREFVDKMIDLCQQVEDTYSYRLTAFLNPRQEQILQSLANHFGLACYSSRAFLATEQVRLIVAPDYYQLAKEDFAIQALALSYARKFNQLTHSQILGALLNQLGIQRSQLGDILMGEEEIVLLDEKFAMLARDTVSKIARVSVKWEECDWTSLAVESVAETQSREILVSSPRLDKIVATTFGLGRNRAVSLIESGQVKVDYVQCKQVAKTIEPGQLVSVRRYGRVTLRDFLGYSKQGKMKLRIER